MGVIVVEKMGGVVADNEKGIKKDIHVSPPLAVENYHA